MNTSELTGELLALWVAKAQNYTVDMHTDRDGIVYSVKTPGEFIGYIGGGHAQQFAPHEDWAQAGPIIERWHINLECEQDTDGRSAMRDVFWRASILVTARDSWGEDKSPLVAAMRAFVRSKFGKEVP